MAHFWPFNVGGFTKIASAPAEWARCAGGTIDLRHASTYSVIQQEFIASDAAGGSARQDCIAEQINECVFFNRNLLLYPSLWRLPVNSGRFFGGWKQREVYVFKYMGIDRL